MSTPVDVLAILDEAAVLLEHDSGEQYAAPVRDVRTAVVELIAATAEVRFFYADQESRDAEPVAGPMFDRLRAALAACGVSP